MIVPEYLEAMYDYAEPIVHAVETYVTQPQSDADRTESPGLQDGSPEPSEDDSGRGPSPPPACANEVATERMSKVLLACKLDAPRILIPVSCTSQQSMVIDLGILSIETRQTQQEAEVGAFGSEGGLLEDTPQLHPSSEGVSGESSESEEMGNGCAMPQPKVLQCTYMRYGVKLEDVSLARCVIKAGTTNAHHTYKMLDLPSIQVHAQHLYLAVPIAGKEQAPGEEERGDVRAMPEQTDPNLPESGVDVERLDYPFETLVDLEVETLDLMLGQVDYHAVLQLVSRWSSSRMFRRRIRASEEDEAGGLDEAGSLLVTAAAGEVDEEGGRNLRDAPSEASGSTTSRGITVEEPKQRMDATGRSFSAALVVRSVNVTLYHDKPDMPPAEARTESAKLAQGAFRGFKLSAALTPCDFCQASLHASLDSLELYDRRAADRRMHFAAVLVTNARSGDDDCLSFLYRANSTSVLLAFDGRKIDITSAEFQDTLTEGGGGLMHLYHQQGLHMQDGLALAELADEDQALEVIRRLSANPVPGIRRATLGTATRSDAEFRFDGFQLTVSAYFAGALLAFFAPESIPSGMGGRRPASETGELTADFGSTSASVEEDIGSDTGSSGEGEGVYAPRGEAVTSTSAVSHVDGVVIDVLAEDGGHGQPRPLPSLKDQIHARARINHPTVVLVEDPFDPHSRVFNADLVIRLDYQQRADVTHVLASIADLTLTSSRYGLHNTQLQVLAPLALTATYRVDSRRLLAKVDLTPVRVNLASADVNCALTMAARLTVAARAIGLRDTRVMESSAGEMSSTGQGQAMRGTQVWNQTPRRIVPCAHADWTRAAGTGDAGEPLPELLQVGMPVVDITLIQSHGMRPVPLLVLSAVVDMELADWSGNMRGHGTLAVAASMMAPHVAAWEPLLLASEDERRQAEAWKMAVAITTPEARELDLAAVQVVRECGHRKVRLAQADGYLRGGAASTLLKDDSRFWAAHGARKNWVVFDMGRSVRLRRFIFKGVGQPLHMPALSELQTGDTEHGPWRLVCSMKTPSSSVVVRSPKFSGAGRFWRWNIRERHGGANKMAFIRHVAFEQQGGGTSVELAARDRLDFTLSSRGLARLVHLVSDWQDAATSAMELVADPRAEQVAALQDVTKATENEPEGARGAPRTIGAYVLENLCGTPLAYSLGSHYAPEEARSQILPHATSVAFSFASSLVGGEDDEEESNGGTTNTTGSSNGSDEQQRTRSGRASVSSEGEGVLEMLDHLDKGKPITDIIVVDFEKKERCPAGYTVLRRNLNQTSKSGHEMYLAYTTDTKYAPVTDVQVIFCGKLCCSSTKTGVLETSPPDFNRIDRNVNYGGALPGRRVYITCRRGHGAPIISLAVVFLGGKRPETVPSGFTEVPKDLNMGRPGSGPVTRLCFRRAPCRWRPGVNLTLPDTPPAVADVRVVYTGKPAKTSEQVVAETERAAGWECAGGSSTPTNINPKGKPAYVLVRRCQQGEPPVTAVRVSESAGAEDWEVLAENLNAGTRAPPLYLHLRRDPGAAPIVTLDFLTEHKAPMAPGFFVLYPQLNKGTSATPRYLTMTLGDVAPGSWEPVDNSRPSEGTVTESQAQAQSQALSRSRRSGRHAGGPQHPLKALAVLEDKHQHTEISVEVEGLAPLRGVQVAELGEATYLVPRLNAAADAPPVRVVVDVHMDADFKTITVRGPLLFRNSLPFPLEVCCPRTPTDAEVDTVLLPGKSYSPRPGQMDALGGDGLLPLFRFYSPLERRHFYCTNPLEAAQVSHSYIQEAVLGFIYAEARDDTEPLWGVHARVHNQTATLFTRKSNYAKSLADKKTGTPGEADLRKKGYEQLGHVLVRPTADTAPLHVFHSEKLGDALVTFDKQEGESKHARRQGDYSYCGLEGHVLSYPGMLRVRPRGGTMTWSHLISDLRASLLPPQRVLSCQRIALHSSGAGMESDAEAEAARRATTAAAAEFKARTQGGKKEHKHKHNAAAGERASRAASRPGLTSYLAPMGPGGVRSAFELVAPLRFRNDLPCRVAVAAVSAAEAVPEEYIALQPGEIGTVHETADEEAIYMRVAFMPTEGGSLSLDASRSYPLPGQQWSKGAELPARVSTTCPSTMQWMDADSDHPRNLALSLEVDRQSGGAALVTVSCPQQLQDLTGMKLAFTHKRSSMAGVYAVRMPKDLTQRTPQHVLQNEVGLFNPPIGTDETVVASLDGMYRSRSFDLQASPAVSKVPLYRLNAKGVIEDLDKPDIELIMTWAWADRLRRTRRFQLRSAISFTNNTTVPLEVRRCGWIGCGLGGGGGSGQVMQLKFLKAMSLKSLQAMKLKCLQKKERAASKGKVESRKM